MELNDFISKFAEVFDETDVNTINAQTEYAELDEWSSMIALSVIAMIDAEYDVQIKANILRDCKTVEELFNKIKSIKG